MQARDWLDRVAGAQAPGVRVSLARARLAVDTAAVDADARLAEAVAAVAKTPAGGETRLELAALQSEHACRRGDAAAGITQRRDLLAQAAREHPQRRRLQRRLVLLSRSCEAPQ